MEKVVLFGKEGGNSPSLLFFGVTVEESTLKAQAYHVFEDFDGPLVEYQSTKTKGYVIHSDIQGVHPVAIDGSVICTPKSNGLRLPADSDKKSKLVFAEIQIPLQQS